ncbi:insulinase family protein, partial [Patescibacteria group bacterium]|nr:insulinase family protein [Patescibacteria group bacterium]
KKTEQVHIALGFRTVPVDSPDRYALSLLSSILGGGMSSRLFHEVREKRGLAYYVRTVSEHYLDCGNLVSYAGVDTKRVLEAVEVVLSEYKNLRDSKPGKKIGKGELKKAKEFMKGHLILELEDSRSMAGFYASQEILENNIEKLDEVLKKIDKTTAAQINEVAKKYFVSNGMNLAVIGNFEDGRKFEQMLKI